MNWKAHIETNDNILVGKPIIKGTRISVEHIINYLPLVGQNNKSLKIISGFQKIVYKQFLLSFRIS
jgi:uncharacterized protein (DUF433 family)